VAPVERTTLFRLQTGTFYRFVPPGCLCILAFFGVGAIIEEFGRINSSPLIFVLVPVVAIPLLWLLLTTTYYGDLRVSSSQISRRGLFGFVRTIARDAVNAIVRVTVIDQGRYGKSQRDQLLLVGADGRCHLVLDADYDVDELARELGVPVEREFDPIRRYKLNQKYPGVTAPWNAVTTVVLLGVVLLLAALVIVAFAPKLFGL
jgi:hypothetical protein